MNIENYFLLSLLYYWASSTSLSIGVGYYTIYRPVLSGLLTGVIMGNPILGMIAGAIVNIIYIDFVSTGGSFKGDQCLTAIIAAIITILFEFSPIEASAAAYAFGYFGIIIWKYRLKINSLFVKQYEKQFEASKKPNINIYDGLYPQLILYVISSLIIITSVGLLIIFKDFLLSIKDILFFIGQFLIYISAFNIILKLDNKISSLYFILAVIITTLINPNSVIIFIIGAFIILKLNFNLILSKQKTTSKETLITKKDLVYSWFVWMNFSHSCYSYERLQGLAFAHSMKNIFKKLYKKDEDVMEAIHRHSEFFNTEPNMGTPIHGYVISLEEQQVNTENKDNIMYLKKGMMGIAAGLGDSYTQVVLTPLFVSLSIMLCLDNKFILAILPMMILAYLILSISYSGFIKGYYEGKESLIERINIIKNSKVKAYFPYIFSVIFGVSLGKLLLVDRNILGNFSIALTIMVIALAYVLIKHKRSLAS